MKNRPLSMDGNNKLEQRETATMPLPSANVVLVSTLNNQGASLLENGCFDGAIAYFADALRCWKRVSIEEGLHYPHASLPNFTLASTLVGSLPPVARHTGNGLCGDSEDTCDSTRRQAGEAYFLSTSEERFVYRRPVYFTLVPWGENGEGCLGATLSMIIILNLALAHHLSAIHNRNCPQRLQQALQLYEIVYKLQIEERVNSPRATMILWNNVGEIHRSVNNHTNHQMCMHVVLSTIMFVVDCHLVIAAAELEGFIHNTLPFILRGDCTGAA
jgi:hypothetical protein